MHSASPDTPGKSARMGTTRYRSGSQDASSAPASVWHPRSGTAARIFRTAPVLSLVVIRERGLDLRLPAHALGFALCLGLLRLAQRRCAR